MAGHPRVVTRGAKSWPRGWLKNHKGPGKRCDKSSSSGYECDEYPMAIHVEGGEHNSPSLKSVNAGQNGWIGNRARWLHEHCQLPVGGKYLVAAVPGIPISGYICKR